MSDDNRLRRTVQQVAESLQMAGISHLAWPDSLPRPAGLLGDVPAAEPAPGPAGTAPAPSPPAAPTPVPAPPAASLPDTARTLAPPVPFELSAPYGAPVADRAGALEVLRAEVAGCTRCAELASCRKQTVFGTGSPTARLCFVGEAPGADEDRIGEPFVGAAGQLLDRILAASRLARGEVFILNTLKCRPPQNRSPMDDEIANCWGYAQRQLEILQPEFICCLGSVAARALLQTRESLGRMRGRFFSYRSSRVMVTWHPAYLLRTPAAKQQTWDDMKMLLAEMGISL